jgi:hypothetical protein
MEYRFEGYTYDHQRDFHRLKTQLQRVFVTLLDGEWHRVPTLRRDFGSAADVRCRDLRKEWCGSMLVEERATEQKGVHEYRLDVDSVDPAWARRILGNEIKQPKSKSAFPDDVDLLKEGLYLMVSDLDDIKRLKQASRYMVKLLEKVTTSTDTDEFLEYND